MKNRVKSWPKGGDGARDVDALYRTTVEALERTAATILNRDDARDIVHDAFVTYLARGPRLRSPFAWFKRVARNRALNEVRRRPTALQGQPPSEDRPEHACERRAVEELVREALGRLPERARTALLLRYFAGAPYPELAAKLGVPIPQAHLIVHRSVRRFARELVLVLSQRHGAIECAPAIEQMMGIGAATDDHMDGPCHRCRAVWDEINALRFPALILAPLLAVRRLVKRAGTRVPSLIDPGTGLMAALVAVTLSVSTALSAPAPATEPPSVVPPPATPAVSQTHDSTSEPENEHGEATEDREEPPPETPTSPADADASQSVSILGVTVEPAEGHSHVDARSHDDKGAVVLVCKPLEPCPPEEQEEPEEEPPPEEETTP